MLVDRALETALRFHANQRRKGTAVPYVVHPLAVGILLARAGCSEEVIAAGLLHDTLEDTSMTEDQLRTTFGQAVASLVTACSEPEKSLPWETRKKHTLALVADAALEVRVIVCADKLHNVRTMAEDRKRVGEDVWKRFSRGRAEQAWYYKELVRILCERKDLGIYGPLFFALKKGVQALFGGEEEISGA
jgi:(p)ppGpp synthase/HD superfamily hydrolase